MGSISDVSRRLRTDGRITADEAKALLEAVRADRAVSPEEKAELTKLVTRFADAFDAGGLKLLRDNAASLGLSVPGDANLDLASRPELADVLSGKKTLSTASGRSDPAVAVVQRGLMTLARAEKKPGFTLPGAGADGDLGGETTAALKAFQADRKLPQTGAIDAATVKALAAALKPAAPATPGTSPGSPAPTLTNARFKDDALFNQVAQGQLQLASGAKGPSVTTLQNALIDLGYPMPLYGADGGFGKECARALSNFQKDRGLAVTGRLDKATLAALDKAAPAPGQKAVLYPEYDRMFKDGVLTVTLGVGYDEDGSDLYERKKILDGLASRGFAKLDVTNDAALKAKGIDPSTVDESGTYYLREFQFNGKPVKALVKYVDRDTPSNKERFADGFAKSDLVMYGGHARYGSGPDFDDIDSPKGNFVLGVNAQGHKDGTLQQAYGEHIREVLKDSPNDLERTKLTDDYQLMVFSGCITKQYLDELRGIPKNKTQDNLDFIGSDDTLLWSDIGGNVLTVLDGVMGGKSENDIVGALYERNHVTFTADGFGGNKPFTTVAAPA